MTTQPGVEPEVRVELASRSDVGQVRSANEDSCDTFRRADGAQLLVVADGMGGHQGGATASRMTVATISEIFEQDASPDMAELIHRAVESANTRVYEKSQENSELEGMGTTVVAFVLDSDHRGTVAHVGDSRAYRYRRGQLEPITTDHSVVAEMHRRGLISAEEAAIHPRRNEILRSVGVLPEVEIEVASVEVEPGDRFVLCSDGLSGVVEDDEIAAVVQSETPGMAVDHLIRLANERGGPDNITVQVLAIPGDGNADDPESTAPVELSESGIHAIVEKRSERARNRQLTVIGAALLLGVALFVILQLLGRDATEGDALAPERLSEPAAMADPDTRDGANPVDENADPPRRGIPR